jgi:hypothetical protein
MPAIEAWQEGAGGVVWAITSSDAAVIDVPAPAATTDVFSAPQTWTGPGLFEVGKPLQPRTLCDASDLRSAIP